LADVKKVTQLKAEKNWEMSYLQKVEKVPPECLDALYQYAKIQYECGKYSIAAELLTHYRSLTNDQEKSFSALWGKFAAEILTQNWRQASDDLKILREAIDTKTFKSPLLQLQHRTWLIHWSLFVFFNHSKGRSGLIDMFFQDNTMARSYLNTIQTTCPHILRYLTTVVITSKRRRNVVQDLVKAIHQEGYTYCDPITQFVERLYLDFDFDAAQQQLRECEQVLLTDFFLVSCHSEFVENARLLLFETYCRIHSCIDIRMLAAKLSMDEEAAERWVVDLIRNARLDAKIDSASSHVVMSAQHPNIYQQVIEKTKGLSFRTSIITNNLHQFLAEAETKETTAE